MNETPVIGVVGAGQMGRGIAQVAAQSGCDVHLMDTDEAQVKRALAAIDKDLGRLAAKGKLDAANQARILGRIKGTSALSDLASLTLGHEEHLDDVLAISVSQTYFMVAWPPR